MPQPLPVEEQDHWLTEHIPHRILATVGGLPMSAPWSQAANAGAQVSSQLARRVNGFCMWEGRLTAMRWLIGFVGISGTGCYFDAATGKHIAVVGRPKPFRFDVFSSMFDGGDLFPDKGPDAEKLALVWKGCTQAT